MARELRDLERDCLRFLRERDEARREICNAAPDPKDEAARRGWASCFDEFDARGLHGDPREIHVEGHFHMNCWVDGPRPCHD